MQRISQQRPRCSFLRSAPRCFDRFRGQGIGIAKAIVSLSMFHQGRIWCMDWAKERNRKLGYLDDE